MESPTMSATTPPDMASRTASVVVLNATKGTQEKQEGAASPPSVTWVQFCASHGILQETLQVIDTKSAIKYYRVRTKRKDDMFLKSFAHECVFLGQREWDHVMEIRRRLMKSVSNHKQEQKVQHTTPLLPHHHCLFPMECVYIQGSSPLCSWESSADAQEERKEQHGMGLGPQTKQTAQQQHCVLVSRFMPRDAIGWLQTSVTRMWYNRYHVRWMSRVASHPTTHLDAPWRCTPRELLTRAACFYLHEQKVKRVMWDVLQDLSRLHAVGVLHGDVKPSNIMVDEDYHGWLIDFGFVDYGKPLVSRAEGSRCALPAIFSCASSSRKQFSGFRGTPLYAAPEVRHQQAYGYASDVWSLGATMLTLLTFTSQHWRLPDGEVSLRMYSDDVLELYSHMCDHNDTYRWTAKKCLEHRWFASLHAAPTS